MDKYTVLLSLLIAWVGWEIYQIEKPVPKPKAKIVAVPVVKPKGFTIMAVGDMMLGSNFPSKNMLPPNDGQFLLDSVAELLQSADLTFGNLEGVLLTGSGTAKRCANPANCFAFKSPDYYAGYLKKAGFDVLSVANNHSGDFGDKGRKNTGDVLKKYKLGYAGYATKPYSILKRNGMTYGICAFAPNNGTANMHNIEEAKTIVAELNKTCDIVIVSFHGGAEGIDYQHITRQNELFLGENRGNPYQFARDVIDAGADLVFGHGPHVTRAVDMYKGRFIAYSLGNFATYGFNQMGPLGVAPIIEISVDATGAFLGGQIYSVMQTKKGGPSLDPEQEALRQIIELTKTDMPEARLRFGADGTLRLR
jgi:poly-gamma-glutamate capsule biosynthesis protein CapA/YwtB (metallophosphatase superfamily)